MLSDAAVFLHLGEACFAHLVRCFYALIPTDPILGPLYARSMAETGETLDVAEARLRDFLVQRFGGPTRYSEARGHPRLRARHMKFAITPAGAERWIALMEQAMTEAQIPEDAREVLRPYFHQTAHFMVNQ